jgi:hypothetical protein
MTRQEASDGAEHVFDGNGDGLNGLLRRPHDLLSVIDA